MTTTETHTEGIAPAVNDLLAGGVVGAAYVTRYAVLAEQVERAWWHLPLFLATDLLIPLLGAVWLLAVPTWMLYQRVTK